ncbi:MAG: hypothetical protein R3Y28_06800 [Candidatus Gastranaerophilales bacterium]
MRNEFEQKELGSLVITGYHGVVTPLRWNASEQRQKANPSIQAGVIPLPWRGGNEVDGVVSMVKK